MAAGILAGVNSGAGYTASGSSVIYTCPLAANYAVIHMDWAISSRALSNFGGAFDSQTVLKVGSYIYAVVGSGSSNGAPGPTNGKNGTTSIMLGPGQSLEITYQPTQTGGSGGQGVAGWDILMTGYEG
jgi:hypothetical protein